MHGLLSNYGRGDRLASTLTCAGLGGCCICGGAGEKCCSGGGTAGRKTRLDRTRSESRWKLGFITDTVQVYDLSVIKINEQDIFMEIGRDGTCQGP